MTMGGFSGPRRTSEIMASVLRVRAMAVVV
jgi:hypothetical protein